MNQQPENLYTKLILKLKEARSPTDIVERAETHLDNFSAEAEYAAEKHAESHYEYVIGRDQLSDESFAQLTEYFRRGLIKLGFPVENITCVVVERGVVFQMRCTF